MVTTALLTVACAFGTTVWLIMAHVGRNGHLVRSLFYTLLGAAYATIGVLLAFRLAGRPILPTTTITLSLLTIIFAVPPGIVLVEWLAAQQLLRSRPPENGKTVAEEIQEVRELLEDE